MTELSSYQSDANIQITIQEQTQIEQAIQDMERSIDFELPWLSCVTAVMLGFLSAGLFIAGYLRQNILGNFDAALPFWIMGGILLIPTSYYIYQSIYGFCKKKEDQRQLVRRSTRLPSNYGL